MALGSLIQRCCCGFLILFPRIVCYGFFLWGGSSLCFQVALQHIGGVKGFILFISTLFLALCGMISYYRVISVGGGSAYSYPELRISEKSPEDVHDYDFALKIGGLSEENLQRLIEIGDIAPPPDQYIKHTYTINPSGLLRFCSHCKIWKPDRCHHCSSCKSCVLKMDHHCPWFSTCIGFHNHKFFVQFLGYAVLLSLVSCFSTAKILYDFIFNGTYLHHYFSINLLSLFVFGAAFGISVGLFFGFSVYQVLINRTTLETYDYLRYRIDMDLLYDDYYKYSNRPNSDQFGNIFDLSTKSKNWRFVMGDTWMEWCLPIRKTIQTHDYYLQNGLCFQVNSKVLKELSYNSRLQRQLAVELNNYRMRRMNSTEN